MEIGDKYKTNKYGWLTIKDKMNSQRVHVIFDLTGFETTAHPSEIRRGRVKDRFSPSVYGVGYVGDGHHKSCIGGHATKARNAWRNMLKRCYDDECQATRPTYIGCTVHPDWHNFQVFAQWYEDNHIDGYEIDKDLLGDGKMYSEDVCAFVPPSVNSLFTGPSSSLPIGVHTQHGRYQAAARIHNKYKHLGSYDTPEEAHTAWKQAKADHVTELLMDDNLDPRIVVRLEEIVSLLMSDEEWAGL